MKIAGIDGCRMGWMLIAWDWKAYEWGVYPSVSDWAGAQPDLTSVLIDMPIGLSSAGHVRTLEAGLRKELKGRHATVFNPPSREALAFDDIGAARAKNREIEGRSLSVQTWNIMPKIKELDKYLLGPNPIACIESHPELCFRFLNPRKAVLLTKKSTQEGREERLEILQRYESDARELFHQILSQTRRNQVRQDDIIDALCLCVANKLGQIHGLRYLEEGITKDRKGLPIRIAYVDPRK